MNWSDFKGKKIALLGAGKENLSLIRWFNQAGSVVTVCDQRENDLIKTTKNQFPEVVFKIGADYLSGLGSQDIIVRSPGMPLSVAQDLQNSLNPKPILTSSTDLFLGMTESKVVGITGTKGKGTTATILESILKSAGVRVIVAGNIGKPIFEEWDKLGNETIVVLEMSSFQLEDLHHSPAPSIVLPIYPDHLEPLSTESPNYHGSYADYIEAKSTITKYQKPNDTVIYFYDNEGSRKIGQLSKGKKISLSFKEKTADCLIDEIGNFSDNSWRINLTDLNIQGRHIFIDAALAIMASKLLGADLEDVKDGLKNFKGLSHRMERIGEYNGIIFVNDSYATVPEATIAAIQAFKEPIIWIGGGSKKGISFKELAQAVTHSTIKKALLIGQEAENIQSSILQLKTDFPVEKMATIEAAVNEAIRYSKKGEIVLLSPACASKDMFKNAAERGEIFKRLVHEHGV